MYKTRILHTSTMKVNEAPKTPVVVKRKIDYERLNRLAQPKKINLPSHCNNNDVVKKKPIEKLSLSKNSTKKTLIRTKTFFIQKPQSQDKFVDNVGRTNIQNITNKLPNAKQAHSTASERFSENTINILKYDDNITTKFQMMRRDFGKTFIFEGGQLFPIYLRPETVLSAAYLNRMTLEVRSIPKIDNDNNNFHTACPSHQQNGVDYSNDRSTYLVAVPDTETNVCHNCAQPQCYFRKNWIRIAIYGIYTFFIKWIVYYWFS